MGNCQNSNTEQNDLKASILSPSDLRSLAITIPNFPTSNLYSRASPVSRPKTPYEKEDMRGTSNSYRAMFNKNAGFKPKTPKIELNISNLSRSPRQNSPISRESSASPKRMPDFVAPVRQISQFSKPPSGKNSARETEKNATKETKVLDSSSDYKFQRPPTPNLVKNTVPTLLLATSKTDPTKSREASSERLYKKLVSHDFSVQDEADAEPNPFSKENLLAIETFIPLQAIKAEEDHFVVYEGPLLKFKPGTNFNWVERWCVVTKTNFMYYKSKSLSQCKDSKPLVIANMNDLVAVYRLNMELPDYKKNKKISLSSDKGTYQNLFQFEILDRKNNYPYEKENLKKIPNEEEKDKTAPEFDVNELHGYKLWDNYVKNQRQRENSPSHATKGYLMRAPDITRTFKNNNVLTNRPEKKNILPSKVNTTRDVKSPRAGQVKLLSHRLQSPTSNTSAGRRTPDAEYQLTKNRVELTSWTNREKEWYYSEKRLLFSTPNSDEREKWVSVLNHLIANFDQE